MKPSARSPRAQGMKTDEVDWSPSLRFRLFGEDKIFYWLAGLGATMMGASVLVVIHFILKYW